MSIIIGMLSIDSDNFLVHLNNCNWWPCARGYSLSATHQKILSYTRGFNSLASIGYPPLRIPLDIKDLDRIWKKGNLTFNLRAAHLHAFNITFSNQSFNYADPLAVEWNKPSQRMPCGFTRPIIIRLLHTCHVIHHQEVAPKECTRSLVYLVIWIRDKHHLDVVYIGWVSAFRQQRSGCLYHVSIIIKHIYDVQQGILP